MSPASRYKEQLKLTSYRRIVSLYPHLATACYYSYHPSIHPVVHAYKTVRLTHSKVSTRFSCTAAERRARMEEEHHTGERRAFPHSPPHPFRASVRSTIGCCATRPSFPNIPSPIHVAQAGLSAVAASAICSVKNMGIRYGRAIRTSRSLSLRSMWRAQPSWGGMFVEVFLFFFLFFPHLLPRISRVCYVMLTRRIDMLSFQLFFYCRAPRYS